MKQRQRYAPAPTAQSFTVKKWVRKLIQTAVGKSAPLQLRVRLKGNHLHLLCETVTPTTPKQILNYLVAGIQKKRASQGSRFALLHETVPQPIEQVIVYGRVFGEKQHDWVKTIHFHEPQTPTSETLEEKQGAIISYQSLARSGSPDAIATYLNHQFSHLGVKIQVRRELLSPLPALDAPRHRLKIICECNYSPDPTLLAEPISQELRDLQLYEFAESLIFAQVCGENSPDWILKVDLTPESVMLREWAKWGDLESILRLLNHQLHGTHLQVRGRLNDKTLHLFCSHDTQESPEEKTTVEEIIPCLDELSPQGIEALTLYGIRPLQEKNIFIDPDLHPEKPVWIHWHKLPASVDVHLKPTPLELAQKHHLEALQFLIHRALNPDLNWRLHTGGISIQLRSHRRLLHILTEAVVCPAQSQVMAPLETLFQDLSLSGIQGIRVYGRRSGQFNSLWHQGIDFVKRSASVADLLPEFTSLYCLDLEPETEIPEYTTTTAPAPKQQPSPVATSFLKQVSHTGQWLLGKSGLFISHPSSKVAHPPLYSQNSSDLQAYRGAKVAMVWTLLGLILTVQLDWLLGRMVASPSQSTPMETVVTKANAEVVAPKPMVLPELSLQKSEWNQEGSELTTEANFTQPGTTEIISEVEARDQAQQLPSVSEILETRKAENPLFNNPFLEEKLALYQHRVAEDGVPDVLIIGSSRAMRGIDPRALQTALVKQGYPELNIFNFGINGATVKVVDLVLRQLLPPEALPRLVIFADGARAFNSGRTDTTYDLIQQSEGYEQVIAGLFPPPSTSGDSSPNPTPETLTPRPSFAQQTQAVDQWLNRTVAQWSSVYPQREDLKAKLQTQLVNWLDLPQLGQNPNSEIDPNESEKVTITPNGIDYDGFFPVSLKFNPTTYYDHHPQVPGIYDGDYQNFNLKGEQHQSLITLIQYLDQHQVQFVFVNQPLTDDYLDPLRLQQEEDFHDYLQNISHTSSLIFRDFVNRQSWQSKYSFFSDPSHLNRYGAYQLSYELALDPMLNWEQFRE